MRIRKCTPAGKVQNSTGVCLHLVCESKNWSSSHITYVYIRMPWYVCIISWASGPTPSFCECLKSLLKVYVETLSEKTIDGFSRSPGSVSSIHPVLRYHKVIPFTHSYSMSSLASVSLDFLTCQRQPVPLSSWCFYDIMHMKDLTVSLAHLCWVFSSWSLLSSKTEGSMYAGMWSLASKA